MQVSRSAFAVVHDIDGPKMRLGFGWFVVSVGACMVARPLLAVVMAAAAACASEQLVRLHDPLCAHEPAPRLQRAQRLLSDPARLVAVLGAASMPLAAAMGSDTLAAAMGATVVLAMVAAGGRALLPVLGAIPIGLAAASPLLLHRLGMAAALFLLLLIAAYDAGDFIVGTGAGTTWEGPVAGIAAVAVVGFATTVIAPPPLLEEGAGTLAILVAMLAPLGPPVASALIGDGARPARFVRRLDSLIIAGPISAYVLAALLPRLDQVN
jgi:hypothetical protein